MEDKMTPQEIQGSMELAFQNGVNARNRGDIEDAIYWNKIWESLVKQLEKAIEGKGPFRVA